MARRVEIEELKGGAVEKIELDDIVLRQFLTPYLLLREQQSRPTVEKVELVDKVMERVEQYLHNEGDEMFRGGELCLCGSVAEGSKVSNYDEFDYQYLIDLVDFDASLTPLLRTRPNPNQSKTYFKLVHRTTRRGEYELSAFRVHDLFLEEIGRAVSHFPMDYCLKKAGPAVKLVFSGDANKVKLRIKIDITLGIRVNPLDLFTYEDFTPRAHALLDDANLRCHFVAANDYWKLCFIPSEQEMMRRICDSDIYKGACYRAIKCLRDEVDVKDVYGDGILQSYPIKVTFMDIALKDIEDGKSWSIQDVGHNVTRVLQEVEARGQGHKLTNLILKDDDVMADSDRSYLESRRILRELKRLQDIYLREKSLVLTFLILYLGWWAYCNNMKTYFTHKATKAMSADEMAPWFFWRDNVHEDHVPLRLGLYPFFVRPFVPFFLGTSDKYLRNEIKSGMYDDTFHIFIVQGILLAIYAMRMKASETGSIFPGVWNNLMAYSTTCTIAIPLIKSSKEEPFRSRDAIAMLQLLNAYPILAAASTALLNALYSLRYGTDVILHDNLFSTSLTHGWEWDITNIPTPTAAARRQDDQRRTPRKTKRVVQYVQQVPYSCKCKWLFMLFVIFLSSGVLCLTFLTILAVWVTDANQPYTGIGFAMLAGYGLHHVILNAKSFYFRSLALVPVLIGLLYFVALYIKLHHWKYIFVMYQTNNTLIELLVCTLVFRAAKSKEFRQYTWKLWSTKFWYYRKTYKTNLNSYGFLIYMVYYLYMNV